MNTHPTFARAMLGGFVGTVAMTAMMCFVAPMMGLNLDIAAMLGSMLGGSWSAGLFMHFLNGTVIFPAIYVDALYARIPGSAMMKGTAWGIALWLVAQTVVMPMMGAGVSESIGAHGSIRTARSGSATTPPRQRSNRRAERGSSTTCTSWTTASFL